MTEPTSDRTAGGTVAQSDAVRDALFDGVIDFLTGQDLLTQEEIRIALAREIDRAGPAANHLSYADANVIEVLLQRSCGAVVANRLTALAGPKIFSDRRRRFSSLCFGTIKVPQSADVSSEEAVLTARDVARAARQSIDAAFARLAARDLLVMFGEGTRSPTAGMQRMLPGTARYLARPGTIVVPVGLAGAEHLFPIGDPTIHPARVVMTVGRPLAAETLFVRAAGDRRVVSDAIGLAVADLLPPEYRGVYRDRGPFADASTVLEDCR